MRIIIYLIVIVTFTMTLNTKEQNLVLLTDLGACAKCVFIPDKIIKKLHSDLDTCGVLKVHASVFCKRDIELKIFERDYNWDYTYHRDTLGLKQKYGFDNIILIDEKGKQLSSFNTFEEDFKYEELLKFIKNYLCDSLQN